MLAGRVEPSARVRDEMKKKKEETPFSQRPRVGRGAEETTGELTIKASRARNWRRHQPTRTVDWRKGEEEEEEENELLSQLQESECALLAPQRSFRNC